MELGISERVAPLLARVKEFIDTEVRPVEGEYIAEIDVGDRWALTDRQVEIMADLHAKAKAEGLWNFFLRITNINESIGSIF